MTIETTRDVADVPRITRDTDAREVALAAYEQLLGLLRRLDTHHWTAPTDCPDWHVADMVRHLVGAARGYASVPAMLRQQAWAMWHRRDYDGNALDACNDLQVRDHAGRSPAQLVDELRALAPRAVAGRLRTPAPVRALRVPLDEGGSTATGMPGTLRLGHLMDTVLTRDVWLHGVDIERATGVQVDRSGLPDVRVVEDAVAEWASRHGEAVELHLTGPAGGRFRQGAGGGRLELDAVEFCRILSGRAPGEGLLARRILF